MDRQKALEREAAFLSLAGDAAAVYRLDGKEAGRAMPLERVRLAGESPVMAGYDLIAAVPMKAGADARSLLESYVAEGFVRASDIVAFKQRGGVKCWYVDALAFSKLPGLLENSLKNVEMLLEQNYNQLDGLVNNIAPKTSVRNTLRQYQEETAHRAGAPPDVAKDRGR